MSISDSQLVRHDVLVTTARLSTGATHVILSGTLLLAGKHDRSNTSSNSSSSSSHIQYWTPRKTRQNNSSSATSRSSKNNMTQVSGGYAIIKLPFAGEPNQIDPLMQGSTHANLTAAVHQIEQHLLRDILSPLARYAASGTNDTSLQSITVCPVPCDPVLEGKCYLLNLEEKLSPLCKGDALQSILDAAWLKHVEAAFAGGRVVQATGVASAGLSVGVMSFKDLLETFYVNKKGMQEDAKRDMYIRHDLLKQEMTKTKSSQKQPPLDFLVVYRIRRWGLLNNANATMLARLSSPKKRETTTTITSGDDAIKANVNTNSSINNGNINSSTIVPTTTVANATIPTVPVTEYLQRNLNNKKCPVTLELIEREDILMELKHLKKPLAYKPTAYRLLSPRGSGKTQLIKRFVHKYMNEECARGGVIVIECNWPSDYMECIQELRRSTMPLKHNAIEHFIINIISRHIGRHSQEFATVREVYAAWVSMCRVDCPLLIFDSVQYLPGCDLVSVDGSQCSTIEVISHCLPPGYAVLFMGTSSDVMRFTPMETFYKTLEPLQPLSFAGYIEARNSVWHSYPQYPDGCTDTTSADWLLYALGGGLPMFMRIICDIFAASKDWGTNMNRLYTFVPMFADGDEDNFVANFIGLLMAGTVYEVGNLDDTIPYTDQTYRKLTMGILLPKCVLLEEAYEFRVCPLLAIYLIQNMKVCAPPEEWGPLPRCFNLAMLFFPWNVDEVLIPTHTARGKPFERIVANALVGRYYLLHNMGESPVTLAQLLNVARRTKCYEVLNKLNVNLSGGICFSSPPPHGVRKYFTGDPDDDGKSDRSNALVYSSEKYAKHDMLFTAHWNSEYAPKCSAIKYTTGKECHVAIQCRHGYPKQPAELLTQVTGTPDDDDMLLLVVQLCDEPLPPTNDPVWEELQKKNPVHCIALQELLLRGMLHSIDASRFCRVWAPYLLTPDSNS